MKSLYEHQSIHSEPKFETTFVKKCSDCEFIGIAWQMQQHIKRQHQGKSYKCDRCDYETRNIVTMLTHKGSKHDPGVETMMWI